MWNVLQRIVLGAALCAALVGTERAQAASLELMPASPSVFAGSPLDVDIVIAGLGAGAAPTLAAFDLDVSFLPSALSFVSVSFGFDLGFPGGDAITASGLLGGPLRIDLAAYSLLSNATLNANQPDTFVLATLHFLGLAPGTSPLAITQAVLANTAGGPGGNAIVATLQGASVDVLPVPEATTVALVGLGVALLGAQRRAR